MNTTNELQILATATQLSVTTETWQQVMISGMIIDRTGGDILADDRKKILTKRRTDLKSSADIRKIPS